MRASEDGNRGFEGMLCESSELGNLYEEWIYKTRPGIRRQETLNARLPDQAFSGSPAYPRDVEILWT